MTLRRQMGPSPPRRWTLLKALRVLEVLPTSPGHGRHARGSRRVQGGQSGTRQGWVPVADRVPGGVEYLYETAHEAYRAMAGRFHPDHGGSTEAMQAVNGAMAFVERHYGPHRVALVLGQMR